MHFKRIQLCCILFGIILFTGCAGSKMTPSQKRSYQASKTIKKSQRKEARQKEKNRKKAVKRHWKNQSKQHKQAIRRNERKLKKEKSKKGREANDFIGS